MTRLVVFVLLMMSFFLSTRSALRRPAASAAAAVRKGASSAAIKTNTNAPSLNAAAMMGGFAPKATVALLPGKAKLFQDGNPLIYGGAVGNVSNDPQPGDEVLVTDHNGNVLGRGLYNPHSQYRVRMLCRSYDPLLKAPLVDLLSKRFEQALALRKALGLPMHQADSVYRLVNGEGDRLGGLIVDVFDHVVVAQSSALWCERHKETILDALSLHFRREDIIWRVVTSRLKQDGGQHDGEEGEGKEEQEEEEEGAAVVPSGGKPKEVVVYERGIKYLVRPEDGQKTGFYCDQRSNRQLVKSLSKGKSVLDTYCYSGGFGINALLGDAASVVCVDSSQPALDTARENFALNELPASAYTLVKADAVQYMKHLKDEGKHKFDLVICDPPKLAPSRAMLNRAKNKYQKINSLALSLVKPGGLLFTFTCSAAMTQTPNEFRKMLIEAAKAAGRDITILSTTGAAADHPIHASYDEGRYLTGMLINVVN